MLIAGVDEAGRGPLAGPVIAAGVALDEKSEAILKNSFLIKDSKLLSPLKREMAYDLIVKHAIYEVSITEVDHIERHNILASTMHAMGEVIFHLSDPCQKIIVDGNQNPCNPSTMPHVVTQIGADKDVIAVSAASIIAKVTRDRIMCELHKMYPQYGWNKNKGYGTKEHIYAIKQYGITEHHRPSFLRKIFYKKAV